MRNQIESEGVVLVMNTLVIIELVIIEQLEPH